MISFTILTDAPAELRTRLIARGILQNVAGVVPARDGFEYVEVPNPLMVAGQADTRRVFLVKLVRAALLDEENGEPRTDAQGNLRALLLRTKLGKWIAANSVRDTTGGIETRRVGTSFWLARDDVMLGAWQ